MRKEYLKELGLYVLFFIFGIFIYSKLLFTHMSDDSHYVMHLFIGGYIVAGIISGWKIVSFLMKKYFPYVVLHSFYSLVASVGIRIIVSLVIGAFCFPLRLLFILYKLFSLKIVK